MHAILHPLQSPPIDDPYQPSRYCFSIILCPFQPWCGTCCETSTAQMRRPTSAG